MAKRLLGKEVNEAIVANLLERTNALREKGVVPTLGIVRVGADPSDLSYEKGAVTKGAQVGSCCYRRGKCRRYNSRRSYVPSASKAPQE